jgi:hypothetical protein
VKIAQELLRHANSRTTLDIYQQTVTEERRAAQTLVFSNLLADNNGSLVLSGDRTQKHPKGLQKEEVTTVSY